MALETDQPPTPSAPAPVAATSAPTRLGYVDGLRALAALVVVICHMFLTVWFALSSPLIAWLVVHLIIAGRIAVSVFIVLSGFSLMLPVARNANRLPRGALRFYGRRARRILPPYYLAMGLSLVLIWLLIGTKTGRIWDTSIPVTPVDIALHLLLIHNYFGASASTVNFVFWSIALECQIYLIFPLILPLWRRYHPIFCTLLVSFMSLGVLAAVTWAQSTGFAANSLAPQYVGLFACGMTAAYFVTRLPDTSRWRGGAGWLALGCWVVITTQAFAIPLFLLDLTTGVATACLLLAVDHYWLRAVLEWRPLVWIGGFSYSLYLIHAPLIQVLWQYVVHPLGLGDTATYLLLLLVGGPLIVLAAWGFWYVCERPFLNSRNSRLAGARDARKGLPSAAV